MNLKDLEAQALELSREDRAALAAKLMDSLNDTPADFDAEEHERVWVEEALRRDADLDEHPEKGIPSDQVYREVRARLIK